MDNLEKMDKFLEKYYLPRLKQEEIENMNGPITSTEIDIMIKKLPTNKSPGPKAFTGEFYQTFREELIPVHLKLFQKIAEGTLSSSLKKVTITITPKTDKDTTKKTKIQTNITDEYRCNNPQQNTSKQNPTTYSKDHTP